MVKKAVILAGGRGTRFLPYTKACPKEMLPLCDKPVLHYIVEEAVEAGITDVIVVISPEKEVIRRYFSKDESLNAFLRGKGRDDLLEMLKGIEDMAHISFVVQEKAYGSGDALLCAEKFYKGETVVVMNADDVMTVPENVSNVTAQLIACYERRNLSSIAVQRVSDEVLVSCGAVGVVGSEGRDIFIDKVVEKPALKNAPSNLVTLGRYVLTSEYFEVLKNTPNATSGELNLTDAVDLLARKGKVVAYDFIGTRYDMGSKLGSFEAMLEFTLNDAELGAAAMKIVEKKVRGI
jgi:UDP-glucose pyrophosphorylase